MSRTMVGAFLLLVIGNICNMGVLCFVSVRYSPVTHTMVRQSILVTQHLPNVRLLAKKESSFMRDRKKFVEAKRKADLYVKQKDEEKSKDGDGEMDQTSRSNSGGSINTDDIAKLYNKKGYQKYAGNKKMGLEGRLRAVVAYKRNSMKTSEDVTSAPGMSGDEVRELDEMMDDDDKDGEIKEYEDEEETEYERLVMKAIETNKLNELKKNFLIDSITYGMRNSTHNNIEAPEAEGKKCTSTGLDTTLPGIPGYDYDKDLIKSGTSKNEGNSTTDMYTPTSSSWGVFERPRDISKAYGGGRAITKAEMDKLDEELENRRKNKDGVLKKWMTESQKIEKEAEPRIKAALERSRGFMTMGNRRMAVTAIESIQNECSWTSDLGGTVLLELAMALETVDRADDARQIYSKLASVSWNQGIRRNSLQLMGGLDITKQIRKDIAPRKASMDYANMQIISHALEAGLTNEWDAWNKKDDKLNPWYDDDSSKTMDKFKVQTIDDAYNLIILALDPLTGTKIPSSKLALSFRKLANSNDDNKFACLKKNSQITKENFSYQQKMKSKSMERPAEGTFFANIGAGQKNYLRNDENLYDGLGKGSIAKPENISENAKQNVGALGTGGELTGFFSSFDNEEVGFRHTCASGGEEFKSVRQVFEYHLNGTWDMKYSMYDKMPYSAKRYEIGSLRRTYNMDDSIVFETKSTFWGLSEQRIDGNYRWARTIRGDNNDSKELTLSGDIAKSTMSPSIKRQNSANIEIVWSDSQILVTRECSIDPGRSPDLFILWKKKMPVVWVQYYNKY